MTWKYKRGREGSWLEITKAHEPLYVQGYMVIGYTTCQFCGSMLYFTNRETWPIHQDEDSTKRCSALSEMVGE